MVAWIAAGAVACARVERPDPQGELEVGALLGVDDRGRGAPRVPVFAVERFAEDRLEPVVRQRVPAWALGPALAALSLAGEAVGFRARQEFVAFCPQLGVSV